MKFSQIGITPKNGKQVTIREATVNDAKELLSAVKISTKNI